MKALMLCILTCLFALMNRNALAQESKLFLVAGQSNCVGKGDSALSVICEPQTAFEYRAEKDTLVSLKDPVGEDFFDFQHARYGSAWPSFARQYHQLTGDKVIIVPAARDGSSCNHKAELPGDGTWDRKGKKLLFGNAIKKVKMAEAKTALSLSGIIWVQGERDANEINEGDMTADEYKVSLQDLITRFRNELNENVPFYIILTGNYVGHPEKGPEQVRKVQNSVAGEKNKVYVVYRAAKDFHDRKWMRSDGIHYIQTAYNDIGEKTAINIFNITKRANK